jgi:hypothetical protein
MMKKVGVGNKGDDNRDEKEGFVMEIDQERAPHQVCKSD